MCVSVDMPHTALSRSLSKFVNLLFVRHQSLNESVVRASERFITVLIDIDTFLVTMSHRRLIGLTHRGEGSRWCDHCRDRGSNIRGRQACRKERARVSLPEGAGRNQPAAALLGSLDVGQTLRGSSAFGSESEGGRADEQRFVQDIRIQGAAMMKRRGQPSR